MNEVEKMYENAGIKYYKQICEMLEEKMSYGCCGWCE